MKHSGSLGLAMFIAAMVLLPHKVRAETVTVEQKIIIESRVAAYHTVVVNDEDKILEIISNTDSDADVRVFRNKVAKHNKLALTDSLYRQYRQIIPEGTSRVGLVYKYYDFKVLSYGLIKPNTASPSLAAF